MHDPSEGVASDGTITTGAARSRVPAVFEPVVTQAVEALDGTVLLYGSVATGQARPGRSDVDLLTLDVDPSHAREVAARLSARFADVCRGVEVAAASSGDFTGDGDEAYGGRVFLRHYCVPLAGPDPAAGLPAFPADARAARGFNGDLAVHAARWRAAAGTTDPAVLGRRVARKTLLAVAGLVSVHDGTWTTDRARAAARWSQLRPGLVDGLSRSVRWSDGADLPDGHAVRAALDEVVAPVVADFADHVGLW